MILPRLIRWLRARLAPREPTPSFEVLLRRALGADDGVVLRVSTLEGALGSAPAPRDFHRFSSKNHQE